MEPKQCRSRQDLELLGRGNDYGDCCMQGEPIDCLGIPIDEINQLFEEARVFLIKHEAIRIAGEVKVFGGLLTLGIGSIVSIINTNIEMSALKKRYQVNGENFKTSVFRLYSSGYRVKTADDNQLFRLERTGVRESWGRIF